MAEYECLEDFNVDILMEISDVDTATLAMMLGVAQAKFCRDTRVLQQVTTTTLEEGKFSYSCVPQWQGYNQTIDTVQSGKTAASLNPLEFNDQFTISADRTSVLISENFVAGTRIGDRLDIVSTVIPYKTTEQIDTNVYELYGYILTTLAKSLILNQRNKPWSDQGTAQSLLFEYNQMLNTVSFDTIAGGNTSGNQSINLDGF
jgi:hypothetical protein